MKILLSGYYGFGNIGDEAVLEALKQGFKAQTPAPEISVLSAGRSGLLTALRKLADADVLVSGGGTLFQDATSNLSFWYYISIILLAKLLGKKTAVFAQGFGPLSNPINRLIARFILNRVDLITLRDEISLRQVKELGVGNPSLYLTADPTFILPAPDREKGRKLLEEAGVDLSRRLLGISVRSAVRGFNPADNFYRRLAEQTGRIAGKHDLLLVFLPFQMPADAAEIAKVVKYLKEKARVVSARSPEEMLAIFSCFDAFIGMRLHSLIFSAINLVPIVGIAYDPKVKSFMEMLDQPCLDFNQIEGLESAFDGIYSRREELRGRLKERTARLRDKAGDNFRLFFEMLGGGK